MNKKKLACLVAMVVSIAVVLFAAYFFFSGKIIPPAEHYWWQDDPEIVSVSERFKTLGKGQNNRRLESVLLFPVIKVGMSTREVEALLSAPDLTYPGGPGNLAWQYCFSDGSGPAIHLFFSDKHIVIYKLGNF